MKIIKQLFTTLGLTVALFSQHSNAASFDCSKASHVIEKEICSNTELSNLDDRLAELYKKAIAGSGDQSESLRNTQKSWISKARDCGKDNSTIANCLKTAYNERIALLEARQMLDGNSQPIATAVTEQPIQLSQPIQVASAPEAPVEQSVPPTPLIVASAPVEVASQVIATPALPTEQSSTTSNSTGIIGSIFSTLGNVVKAILSFIILSLAVSLPFLSRKIAPSKMQSS